MNMNCNEFPINCKKRVTYLQIFDEKAEAAQRESRLQHKLNRQRTRIEELSTEKTELLERIKRLERTRLTGQSTVAEEMANQTLKIDELSNNVIIILLAMF